MRPWIKSLCLAVGLALVPVSGIAQNLPDLTSAGNARAVRCVNTAGTAFEACGGAGLTSIATGQQAVTTSAVALPSTAGKVVCVKVKDGGTQTVYYGPTGITTSTGMELLVGESICRSLDNSNRIFVIAGGTGSTVSFEVLN